MEWGPCRRVRRSFTVYSAFLAFLFRAPSLSSSLLLSDEGAEAAGGWWWASSEPPRGERKSTWHIQDSMRAKGELWEWRAVIHTWGTGKKDFGSFLPKTKHAIVIVHWCPKSKGFIFIEGKSVAHMLADQIFVRAHTANRTFGVLKFSGRKSIWNLLRPCQSDGTG